MVLEWTFKAIFEDGTVYIFTVKNDSYIDAQSDATSEVRHWAKANNKEDLAFDIFNVD